MKREELTERILDIKREKGWTWRHITDEIGGMSPVLVVGALLGQMKLPKPLAETAASLFGLSEAEQKMLNEIPNRGTPMPPTDPLLYRFYEMVMVNGPALKALIEEEFGDGIMSAIDFEIGNARQKGPPAGTRHGHRGGENSSPTNIMARRGMLRPMAIKRNDFGHEWRDSQIWRGPMRCDSFAVSAW